MATTWQQLSFRYRNDDGSQAAATWKAATNANVPLGCDVNVRMRFACKQTGTTAATLTAYLRYSRNAGAYTQVSGTSTVVRASASTFVADEEATTQQISTETFVAGKIDELTGVCGATGSVAQNRATEIEFCFVIRSVDVNNGDTIALRVYRSSSLAFTTYTQVPSITVQKATQTVVQGVRIAANPTLRVGQALPTIALAGGALAASPGLGQGTVTTQAAGVIVAGSPLVSAVMLRIGQAISRAAAVGVIVAGAALLTAGGASAVTAVSGGYALPVAALRTATPTATAMAASVALSAQPGTGNATIMPVAHQNAGQPAASGLIIAGAGLASTAHLAIPMWGSAALSVGAQVARSEKQSPAFDSEPEWLGGILPDSTEMQLVATILIPLALIPALANKQLVVLRGVFVEKP